MRIVIDIGNSKIAVATVDADHRVLETRRIDRSEPGSVESVVEWCLGCRRGLRRAAVASVVPSTLHELRDSWNATGIGVELVALDHRVPREFASTIVHPETVGADRWCNVAAAVHAGAREAIIADLGSAHTYDVLEDGVFVGGLIAPGAGTSHRALVDRGAQLPELPLSDPGVLIGRHTTEAILAGSFHQSGAGIAGVVERLRASRPAAPVFVTGGLATIFASYLPPDATFDSGLTLRGASVLLGN